MKTIPHRLIHSLAVFLLVLGSSSISAETTSTLAVDNSTVQVNGPRMGVNGKRFFNMEGNQNGVFSSFGVADFTLPNPENGFEDGEDARLMLTFVQANASFTHDGALHFWLTTDTTTDIQPGDDPAVRFNLPDDPDGLANQLTPRFFLGSGTFTQVGDEGQVDSFSFRLSGRAKHFLRQQINRGDKIRILVSPADGTVAATYAGYTNVEFSGPVITVNVDD